MKHLIFVLILANLFVYYVIFDFLTQKNLVAFFDVGQGASVLIKNKNNIFLYDTGQKPSLVLQGLDRFIPFYYKKIDILFISHPDKDHYLAAFEILKRYKVRLLAVSILDSEESGYKRLIELVKKLEIPILVLKRGNYISTNHFQIYVLHPDKKYKKDNDNSLVLKVIGKNSYLLTGDIEKEAIQSLISCCLQILASDYLLVPHHGSRYSINEKFYKAINPKVSVIQVGHNFYGHPHQETINFLKSLKATIWRTDLNKEFIIYE